MAILEARREFRTAEKERKRTERPNQVVARIPSPRPAQTSMATLARPVPQKEIVVFPQVNAVFPGLEKAKA